MLNQIDTFDNFLSTNIPNQILFFDSHLNNLDYIYEIEKINEDYQHRQSIQKKLKKTVSNSPLLANLEMRNLNLKKNILNQSPPNNEVPLNFNNFDDYDIVSLFKQKNTILKKKTQLQDKKIYRINEDRIQKKNLWNDEWNCKNYNYQFSVEEQLQQHNNQINQDKKFNTFKINQNTEKQKKQRGNCHQNLRGLRNISQIVTQIVYDLKNATYKQVVNKFICKLNQEKNINLIPQSKDQKNLKRRIYDALNVLISADIFVKQQKYVKVEYSKNQIINKCRLKQKAKLMDLQQNIEEQKKNILKKYKKFSKLKLKYKAISNLRERNKNNIQNHHQFYKIHFPLITIQTNIKFQIFGNNDQQKKNLQNSQKKLIIKAKIPLKLKGDIDLLLKLNFQQDMNDLPKQLQQYRPQFE